jgi:acyl-CoA synthetase (NDP forming)
MASKRFANFKRLLRPRSIAFVGGQQMERCINMCRSAGFTGDIWSINPRYDAIAGIPCVASIDELPAVPDVSFIALSPERSIDVVAQLAKAGAPGAIVHASGFGERGGEHLLLEQRLADAAGDMAIIGPNTQGLLNNFDGIAIWGDINHFERVNGNGVAVISQSGAFLFGITNVEQAYPMGYAISIGNQLLIDTATAIEAVLDDDRVRVIGLYLEGIKDGVALSHALARALRKNIPIVLLRGGGTPAAAQASMSHTGNLAVSNDFWSALIERYGLIEVRSPKQLVETTKLLAVTGIPAGPRVFITTFSGAACTLTAEQAPQRGLRLPPVPDANSACVRHTLPEYINITNPFDLNLPWVSRDQVSLQDGDSIAKCIIDVSDGQADTIAMLFDIPRSGDGQDDPWLPSIDAMIQVRKQTGLPCVVASIMPEGVAPQLRKQLLENNVAPIMGMTEFLDALGAASRYRERRAQLLETGNELQPLLRLPVLGETVICNEWDSKNALSDYGLVMPERWVGLVEDSIGAAENIGYPVALKILSNQLAHKAKLGGVALNLNSADAVAEATEMLRHNLRKHGIHLEQVLVEKMVTNPAHELIIGIKRHEQLGLALLVGQGGVDVENQRQYALVLLPATHRDFDAALTCIGKGLTSAARNNVLQAMQSVASFAIDHIESLAELDINPIIVSADGSITAVDALIVASENYREAFTANG